MEEKELMVHVDLAAVMDDHHRARNYILLKIGSYSSTAMCQYWDNHLILLSSILTILLTCPNNNTLLCYSNEQCTALFPGNLSMKRVLYQNPF